MTLGMKSHSKIGLISWRNARPLQRRVRRASERDDCYPQECTTPAPDHTARRGSRLNHLPHKIIRCTTGSELSHTPHVIRLSMMGSSHHERSHHTGTTSTQHHEGSYHLSTTSTPTTSTGTTRIQIASNSPFPKGVPTTFPSSRTPCRSAARSQERNDARPETRF